MSCNGKKARPGAAYTSDAFAASTSSLAVKCDGSAIPATIASLGNGNYEAKIAGLWIFCPGPIEIFDGETRVYCAEVEPCP
jgi:hypothetical protein